jgi:Na+/melibiose symporter-like transporter
VEQVGDGSQPRVPLSTKLLFGSGSVAEGVKNTAFNVFLLFYYNNVLGLPGTWTGTAIFLALCVDAVADPVIGSLSDGWHSRLGRRHPFMYAAPLPMALAFVLLFRPPDGLSQLQLFGWLLTFAVAVRVAMTLYMLPSNAMVPELTPHYDERTSLVSFRFLFGWLGGIVVSQLAYLHFFASAEGATDGLLQGARYAGFGAACALLVGGSILLSAAGTHRLIPQLARAGDVGRFSWDRFRGESDVQQSRPLVLIGARSRVAGGTMTSSGLREQVLQPRRPDGAPVYGLSPRWSVPRRRPGSPPSGSTKDGRAGLGLRYRDRRLHLPGFSLSLRTVRGLLTVGQ